MEILRVVDRRVHHAIFRVVGAFVVHRAVMADLWFPNARSKRRSRQGDGTMVTVLISALGHDPRENRLKGVRDAIVEQIHLNIKIAAVVYCSGIICRPRSGSIELRIMYLQ